MLKKLLSFVVATLTVVAVFAQPKREVRAVWLTTNGGLDWPKGVYNVNKQKQNLCAILDELAAVNINTILFQAQVKGDVLWDSTIQPFYRYVTGNPSSSMTYDVSKFVIEECHKRGMECHAWIVPYRIGSSTYWKAYSSNVHKHVAEQHPEWVVEYEGNYFLDPGLPEVREYLLDVYRELIANYDFDGVSFDYTRYPGQDFDDAASFAEYNPDDLSLADWRRNNINTFMAEFYDMAKSINPLIKVGSSPIGTYKNAPGYGNFAGYTQVYQDAIQWMNSGHHDLIVPMMYYNEKHGFTVHMNQWVSLMTSHRQIAIGLAPYKMIDGTNDWAVSEVTGQIEKVRANSGLSGVSFFRADHVIGSESKIQDFYNELRENYFAYPAHIPPMPYNGVTTPATPANVKQERVGNQYIITWDKNDDSQAEAPTKYYEVYLANGGVVDIDDMQTVVGHYVTDNRFVYETDDEGLQFAVSAFDVNYYESAPSMASGIEKIDDLKPARIYYAADRLIVTSPTDVVRTIDIYGASGIRFMTRRVNANDDYVDCSALPQGFYIAVVNVANQRPTVVKFIR